MKSIVKIALGVVLGFILLMGGCAALIGGAASTVDESSVSVSPEPETTPETTETQEPEAEPKSTPKPKAKKVTAKALLSDFEGNEAAADIKYKGKTLRVTGNVAKVDTEFWDEEQYVIQLDSGGEWDIWTVNCNDVTADQAAKVQPRSTVTVRGTFDDGGDLGVELADCSLVK